MPKYNRVKLEFTDLPPERAVAIFSFIYELEEKNLDLEFFKMKIKEFTFEEQYFITKYTLGYFKCSEENYLSKKLKKIKHEFDFELCKDLLAKISNNAETLNKEIKLLQNDIEKKAYVTKQNRLNSERGYFDYPMKKEPLLQDFKLTDKDRKFDKIPLLIYTKNIKRFKEIFFKSLEPCLNKNEIESFFYNTFEHKTKGEIRLLDLEVANKQLLESCMREIINKYKTIVLYDYNNDYIIPTNNKLETQLNVVSRKRIELLEESHPNEEIEEFRKKLNPKQLGKIKVDRSHFMRAMYNAFPYIRTSSEKYLKQNPSKNLEDFFKQKIKNI